VKHLNKIVLALAVGFGLLLNASSCDDNGNGPEPPASCDSLMITSPTEGEAFTVGQTVTVKWCYPEGWPYTMVKVLLYKDDGATKVRWLTSEAGVSYPNNTLDWTVQAEDVGTGIYLRLSEYKDTPGEDHWMGPLTVTAQ